MASDNDTEKRETLADIAAEIRAYGAQPPPRLMWLEIADRIEADWKRDEERAVEHATRHAETVARDNCRDCIHNPNGKNYEPIGNAAATYAALVKIHDLTNALDEECGVDPVEIRDIARAALAEPARNCDLYATATEALKAQDVAFNEDNFKNGECRLGCPGCDDGLIDCKILWLFAPAAERKGSGK